MAANEVLTNALRYGRGAVALWGWPDDGRFLCQIQDDGRGIADPLAGYVPPPDAMEAGQPVAGPAARRPSPDRAELNGDDGQAPRRPVRTASDVAAARRADRPSARVASHLNPLAAPCTGPQIGVVRGGREGPQPHPGVDVPVEEILFGEVISVDGHSCLLPACFGYSCTPLSPRLIKATILGGCGQVGPEFRS